MSDETNQTEAEATPIRVRIVADGGPQNVSVVDARTGAPIGQIAAVTWHARAGELPVARLEIPLAEAALESGVVRVIVGTHILTLDQWRAVEALIERLQSGATEI
jgi:hypothetical protein